MVEVICYLKFPADCSFSTQNITQYLLFMAEYHLCVKYFIYKQKPDLADQIKKAKHTLHSGLLCYWKLVDGRLTMSQIKQNSCYSAIHFDWVFLWLFSPASLTKCRGLHISGYMHYVSSLGLLFLSKVHVKSRRNSTVLEETL